jgi:hypothetical protein
MILFAGLSAAADGAVKLITMSKRKKIFFIKTSNDSGAGITTHLQDECDCAFTLQKDCRKVKYRLPAV